jgi:hypothetical protein
MAAEAQGNQVYVAIRALPIAYLLIVNLQICSRITNLAAPAIPAQKPVF